MAATSGVVTSDFTTVLSDAMPIFLAVVIGLGFLALVSVLKNDAVAAFMWLGLALFVDGVDGTLARKARVLEYTPNFDGRTLDNVIDFFTYVAVPALMVYWFDMTPVNFFFSGQTWSLISAAAIMAVSCYTFANVGMKSDDYYFVGFPAISVPVGTVGGLPVGLQLVAPPHREDLLVATARAVERAVS